MAGDDVIDYVVVHELAHIKELNHSDRFWAIVQSMLPDYRERKERLKQLQHKLNNEDWDYNPEKDCYESTEGNSRWHYADYKTILSPKNGMNLYRGCTHGCIYCDSRSECYQMQHDFEDVEVKRNAEQILESQLRRKREPCMIGTGGMCDPYIQLEDELQVTRRCLEIIEKYGFGLAIQTKSARIMRDIDLLERINEKAKCVVQMTLTTYDDDLCRILEPNVSTTVERFEVLKNMQKVGIPTVVWISPILPFINDTEKNLLGLLDYCTRAGVRGIVSFGFGTTMRDGSREYFLGKLSEHFPGMKEKYIKEFGDRYECQSPNNARLVEVFYDFCQTHGIMYDPGDVFRYMNTLEPKNEQLSLF